ncbi:hypothetical protein [Aestuariivirga sp.]|uniref:hypothetical protein n=1 Tax=Aestuariivirga sp. TaxID=2650926 RepID=UPI003BABE4EC
MTHARAWTVSAAFRSAFLIIALWFALAMGTAPQALADAQCPVPANVCGCSSCGCGEGGVTPRCPAGQEPYDDFCLPSCPDGWNRYPGYPGLCTPPCQHGCPEGFEQVPLPSCPEGYHRDIGSLDDCIADFDPRDPNMAGRPSFSQCPEGMTLSPNSRQCEVECPFGTYPDEQGLCRSYYQDPCPPGFGRDAQTGQCQPPGLWPPGYQWVCLPLCPEGTLRDIYHPTRCLPPPPSCPDGFEDWRGRCVPVCDQGATRDPYGYCAPETCPEGSYPDLQGNCQQPECPQGFDSVRGQCQPPCENGDQRDQSGRCVPQDEGCPPGTEDVRGQCVPACPPDYVRNLQTLECQPPERGCDQGEEYVRGQCVPVCQQGSVRGENGRCVPTGCPRGQEKFGAKCLPICPASQTRDNRGNCTCPQGTETVRGQCLAFCRKGLVRLPGGSCGCPQGQDFVHGRCLPACEQGLVRDKNDRCMPPQCPPGTERFRKSCLPACLPGQLRDQRGRCYCPDGTRLSAKGICQEINVQRPCPDGFRRDDGGNCVPSRRVPQSCPDGFFYSKRKHTCVPEQREQPDAPVLRQPKLQIDPGTLQLLQPPRRKGGGAENNVPNIQDSCPKGYMRDDNGDCIRG